MPRGGKRVGSGRPVGSKSKNTIEREALRQFIFDEVKRNQKKIVAALIRQATKGQVQATKELFERSIGKTKDLLELETKEPIIIKVIDYSHAGKIGKG